MPNTADAVVVGGGVMGCSILFNLAQKGVTNTVLLERDVLASGSTSKSQAILRMHYSNEVTTRLAWDSLTIFRDFNDLVGMPSGYTKTGYFVIVGPEDREAMEGNVAMQRSVGVDTSIVTAEDVREIAPMVETFDGESFAYEPDSGYADPYSVTTGYASAARDMGARVMAGSPATRYRDHRRSRDCRTDRRRPDRDADRRRGGRAMVWSVLGINRRERRSAADQAPGHHAQEAAGHSARPPDHR